MVRWESVTDIARQGLERVSDAVSKRSLTLLASAPLILYGCGGGPTGNDDEKKPEVNSSPSAQVMTRPGSSAEVGEEQSWTVRAIDNDTLPKNQLERIIITYGDGVADTAAVSGNSGEASFAHTYTDAGQHSWNVIAEDRQSETSSPRTGTVNVAEPIAYHDITFKATTFFSREDNADLMVRMHNLSTNEEFVGTTDDDGHVTLTVSAGEYILDFEDDDNWDWHRTDIENTSLDAMCQESDMGDSVVRFRVDGDRSHRVETVDASTDMIGYAQGRAPQSPAGDGHQRSRAMTANAFRDEITVAMYGGRGDLGTEVPPGLEWVLPRDTINARIAFSAMQDAINRSNDLCGRDVPWEIDLRFLEGHDILGYIDYNSETGGVTANENVAFVNAVQNSYEGPQVSTLTVGMGSQSQDIWYVRSSRQGHGGGSPGRFTDEWTKTGHIQETDGRCSVRDSGIEPTCDYSLADETGMMPVDVLWMALDAHYTGIAQLNARNPWVNPEVSVPSEYSSIRTNSIAKAMDKAGIKRAEMPALDSASQNPRYDRR